MRSGLGVDEARGVAVGGSGRAEVDGDVPLKDVGM